MPILLQNCQILFGTWSDKSPKGKGFMQQQQKHCIWLLLHCHTIANAMKTLFELYSCFGTTPFPKEDAGKYTRNFLLLYIQLAKSVEGTDSCLWALKPKFHLMAELVENFVFEEGAPKLILDIYG